MTSAVLDRFLAKVDRRMVGCWLWTASVSTKGYGQFRIAGRLYQAHRLGFEHWNGPIPADRVIDHVCNTPACVNPLHLRLSTGTANVLRGIGPTAVNARKTHCIHGHPFDAANTYYFRKSRFCRACNNRHTATYRRKKAVAS